MKVIIKLHGTSGSGKTTIVRELMKQGFSVPLLNGANRKIEAYKTELPYLKEPLYVLGPYTAVCGGMDSLSDVNDHIRLLHTYSQLGHVIYEGLLASEYYGRLGAASEQYGDNHIFAFLDTPIELCLERIAVRRAARGNLKPLNPGNTVGRIHKIEMLKAKLENVLQRRTVLIDHIKAVEQVADILREYDGKS